MNILGTVELKRLDERLVEILRAEMWCAEMLGRRDVGAEMVLGDGHFTTPKEKQPAPDATPPIPIALSPEESDASDVDHHLLTEWLDGDVVRETLYIPQPSTLSNAEQLMPILPKRRCNAGAAEVEEWRVDGGWGAGMTSGGVHSAGVEGYEDVKFPYCDNSVFHVFQPSVSNSSTKLQLYECLHDSLS
ncbi:hypothetical protein C8J56DRAFT_898818 [Mycena floridula]|nr:hypothetical protein C8J56DRAFT_898818 [Mycena floridula]